MESTLVHIVFLLVKLGKNFKRKLRILRFFTQFLQENYVIVNTINLNFFLPNLYCIESEAFSEHN